MFCGICGLYHCRKSPSDTQAHCMLAGWSILFRWVCGVDYRISCNFVAIIRHLRYIIGYGQFSTTLIFRQLLNCNEVKMKWNFSLWEMQMLKAFEWRIANTDTLFYSRKIGVRLGFSMLTTCFFGCIKRVINVACHAVFGEVTCVNDQIQHPTIDEILRREMKPFIFACVRLRMHACVKITPNNQITFLLIVSGSN